jgi:hypothetical protein
VLVSDLVDGTTLADGGRPADPAAAAQALVAAFRAAALDAGLAPVDARPGHVVVRRDGTLGLLGMGVARPVDRERATLALDALDALAGGDESAFAAATQSAGVLPAAEAQAAHPLLRDVLGELAAGPATLDAAALLAIGERAESAAPRLASLATAASPQPQDLALGRMLAQLVAVLARFEATLDWPAVARG